MALKFHWEPNEFCFKIFIKKRAGEAATDCGCCSSSPEVKASNHEEKGRGRGSLGLDEDLPWKILRLNTLEKQRMKRNCWLKKKCVFSRN
ncbi:hypothetical protein CEXT_609711 [Caerostris extrusa]|uniref:Uncharacterized protein n=1 Tax=Caerostris extrusa TaxID=172846 RepID=A0AAV4PRN6_CAEEX|nr:hypothetical protein CEXT_609711 [Caerostris extrusa]